LRTFTWLRIGATNGQSEDLLSTLGTKAPLDSYVLLTEGQRIASRDTAMIVRGIGEVSLRSE